MSDMKQSLALLHKLQHRHLLILNYPHSLSLGRFLLNLILRVEFRVHVKLGLSIFLNILISFLYLFYLFVSHRLSLISSFSLLLVRLNILSCLFVWIDLLWERGFEWSVLSFFPGFI